MAKTGQGVRDLGTEYFESDTVLDGRACHLIVSRLDTLVLAAVGSKRGPPAVLVPPNKDLIVYARQLTISGLIHLPGQRIEIVADQLSVEAGSNPELRTDLDPPPPPDPVTAGGGVLPSTRVTQRDEMTRLPRTAADFLTRGGNIEWLAPSFGTKPEDLYAQCAWYWANPDGAAGGFPPAAVADSGGNGKSATPPTPRGANADLNGLPNIRVIAKRASFTEPLKLSARGGPGPDGQGGQDGGNGASGGVTERPHSPDQMIYAQPFPKYGGFGGNGGNAACGGSGGTGGRIEYAVISDPSQDKWLSANVSGGPPGKARKPGAAGLGGPGGLLRWPGNYNMQLPRSPDEQAGGVNGNPGGEGSPGTTEAIADPKALFRQRFFLELLASTERMADSAYKDALILSQPSD